MTKKIFSKKKFVLTLILKLKKKHFLDLKKTLSKAKNKSKFSITTKGTTIEGKIKDMS